MLFSSTLDLFIFVSQNPRDISFPAATPSILRCFVFAISFDGPLPFYVYDQSAAHQSRYPNYGGKGVECGQPGVSR